MEADWQMVHPVDAPLRTRFCGKSGETRGPEPFYREQKITEYLHAQGGELSTPRRSPLHANTGFSPGIASAKWTTHTKHTKHTEIAQRPSDTFVSCGMLEFARAALCLRSLGWKYSEV